MILRVFTAVMEANPQQAIQTSCVLERGFKQVDSKRKDWKSHENIQKECQELGEKGETEMILEIFNFCIFLTFPFTAGVLK